MILSQQGILEKENKGETKMLEAEGACCLMQELTKFLESLPQHITAEVFLPIF